MKVPLTTCFSSSGGNSLSTQEAAVVARLRNDESLLEGIISEGKLANQERTTLKDGQSVKNTVPPVKVSSPDVVSFCYLDTFCRFDESTSGIPT